MLNAHPRVLVTNETRIHTFFEHAFKELPTGDRGGLHCAREHGLEVVAALREHGRGITRLAYEKIAKVQGKTKVLYWGDKNPHLSSMLEVVHEWFPKAMYVPVRRDPRDIVCSILELWGRMGLVPVREENAERWDVPDQKIADVCGTLLQVLNAENKFLAKLPTERVFAVDYELLVREPDKVLKPLFVNFLRLPNADDALAAMRATSATDVHGVIHGSVDFAERSVQRWQRDLDGSQREIVNSLLAAVL